MGALLLPGKRVLQVVAGAQWSVQILLIHGRLGKAGVVIGDKRREEGISPGQGARAGQP